MNSDYEKVLKASQLDKMKKDWVEEGRKQGALKAYKEIVNAFFDLDSGKHIKQFCEKRIKELKKEKVKE